MTNLWVEATIDRDQECLDEMTAAAHVAVAEQHGFVLAAKSDIEFQDRLALVSERVASAVERVTYTDPAMFPSVHAAVLGSWEQDFDIVRAAVQDDTQRRNSRRAWERRQARRESDEDIMARQQIEFAREMARDNKEWNQGVKEQDERARKLHEVLGAGLPGIGIPDPGWGEPYGGKAFTTPDGEVWMFRRGQRVRFYDANGNQVGDEQANVAPALAYAYEQGWDTHALDGIQWVAAMDPDKRKAWEKSLIDTSDDSDELIDWNAEKAKKSGAASTNDMANMFAGVPSNVGARDLDPQELLRQIGRGNVLAISGGRASVITDKRPIGVYLPVSNGYGVNVFLVNDDTYVVQRVYRGKVMGQTTDVYADEVGEAAYQASIFRSNDFGGHKVGGWKTVNDSTGDSGELVFKTKDLAEHQTYGDGFSVQYTPEPGGQKPDEKTASTLTEWGVSVRTQSEPYSPEATLSVIKSEETPNQWGGIGNIVRHPEFDGMKFPDADAAWSFAKSVGLTTGSLKERAASLSWTQAVDDLWTAKVGRIETEIARIGTSFSWGAYRGEVALAEGTASSFQVAASMCATAAGYDPMGAPDGIPQGEMEAFDAEVDCPSCGAVSQIRITRPDQNAYCPKCHNQVYGDSVRVAASMCATAAFDTDMDPIGQDGGDSSPSYEDGYEDGYGYGTSGRPLPDDDFSAGGQNSSGYVRGIHDGYDDGAAGNPSKLASKTASASGLVAAANIVAQYWAEDAVVGTPQKGTIYLGDGPVDGVFVTIRSKYGEIYKVQDISGQVDINNITNYRPDPTNPGKWTWDQGKYPAGTYKVWSAYECLFHLTDLGGGNWKKDGSSKIYTTASKTAGENPFAKKDAPEKEDPAKATKSDTDGDGEKDGPAQPGEKPEAPADAAAPTTDQAPADPAAAPADPAAPDQASADPHAVDPNAAPQTGEEQAATDPTTMDVGMSSNMAFTMGDGGSGQIEVTFVREENGVYYFNGPTGEFGVGQQGGQWQDSDGNTFQFGVPKADQGGIQQAQDATQAADAAAAQPAAPGAAPAPAAAPADPAADPQAPAAPVPPKDDSAKPTADAPAKDAPPKDDDDKKKNPFAKKND